MADTTTLATTATTGPSIPALPTGIQKYLDRAVAVLQKFGVAPTSGSQSELTKLLDEVKHVGEAKVLAIAKTIQHMSTFNALVRDNVESINIGNRYLDITQMFDSVREDSKMLIKQLDDGKFSLAEKAQNLWMRLQRGTPSARFEKIMDLYKDVAADTKNQLDREQAIMDGYIDFRFALKEAEILSRELVETHAPTLETAKAAFAKAQQDVTAAASAEQGVRSKLELARDEARLAFEREDRTYQLLKDVAENLSIGYDVGETLVTKLKQTHDVKDQVYRRSQVFFTTNESVFTLLDAVYSSQYGLHEDTQTLDALKQGANKALEDVAELGHELEKAALQAGYGATLNKDSVQKLVDAVVTYQTESRQIIVRLREESATNAKEIASIVEQGRDKYNATLITYQASSKAV